MIDSKGEGETSTPRLDGEEGADDRRNGRNKKTNITLALDDYIVKEMRKEAASLQQSLNTRVNAILRKHVNFWQMTELNGSIVLPSIINQFFIDKVDEAEFISEMKKLYSLFISSLYAQKKIPVTLENLIRFSFEELAVYGGAIKSVSRYTDEQDGKVCIYCIHNYDLKWSRIIGSALADHIESMLHYHTSCRFFSNGFEIKILEKGPF